MTARPLVSVAVPTRNRARFLAGAVESALTQTVGDLEVLVLDNASEDDTKAVAEGFADERVRYIASDVDLGMTANFNRAFDLYRGAYICFLPDDDRLLPEYVERCLDLYRRHPDLGLVSSPDVVWDAAGRELWRYPVHGGEYLTPDVMWRRLVTKGHEISHPLVSRRAVDAVGRFDEAFPWVADYDYWVRVSTTFPVGHVQVHCSVNTCHDEQAVSTAWLSDPTPNVIVPMRTVWKATMRDDCPLGPVSRLRALAREGNPFFVRAVKSRISGRPAESQLILKALRPYVPFFWQAVCSAMWFPRTLCRALWLRRARRSGMPFVHRYP